MIARFEIKLSNLKGIIPLLPKYRSRSLGTGGKGFFILFHIYSKSDLQLIKTYSVDKKAVSANNRFDEKLICLDVLNALKRSNYRCHYCNDQLKASSWQLDHFHSRYLGGKNIPENLAPSCKWCN